jgi:hypothetical protein
MIPWVMSVVQTGSGAHSPCYPMATGGKAAGCEVELSPPTSAQVKKTWTTHPYVFMA